jgi:ketosteroid isomerase-like protein
MPAQSNQPVVQTAIECFMRGDLEGVLARLADDVIWEGPEKSELPYSGIYRGKSGVKEFFILHPVPSPPDARNSGTW